MIHTLSRWGIEGYHLEKKPGVWVCWNHIDAKIAAIGVRIDHGVTIHGFALNVDLDLIPFLPYHALRPGTVPHHIHGRGPAVRRVAFSRRATGGAGIRASIQHSMDGSSARHHEAGTPL